MRKCVCSQFHPTVRADKTTDTEKRERRWPHEEKQGVMGVFCLCDM